MQIFRGEFWSGLASDHVKSPTRCFMFDVSASFEELLEAVRSIELQLENEDVTSLPTTRLHVTSDTSKKLRDIFHEGIRTVCQSMSQQILMVGTLC